jgi:hypothetical protein
MITYYEPITGEKLFDTNMLRNTLKVSPSYLKRELRKYRTEKEDFVRYKNLNLYKETFVLNFINHLVEGRFNKELNTLKRGVEKMRETQNGL